MSVDSDSTHFDHCAFINSKHYGMVTSAGPSVTIKDIVSGAIERIGIPSGTRL